MGRKVNEDLAKERWSCGIKSDEFTAWWYGGWDKVAEKRKYESILKHPEVQHEIPLHYLSHEEMYEEKVRQSTEVLKKVKELREADMNPDEYNDFLGKMEILGMLGTSSPIEVHFSMFIPTIMSQATEEQQKKWLKRARRGEIIGTYAQTEMGHGTFIRGLQTTATYDEKTQEFVLNSPQISAFKFWPGGLGHTANCAIVMAQLIIRGERQGIFPFFVQIRDENTHMPLRGVKVGDIGAKMGLKSTNNGFLGFTNHRIPRENMLMKNAQVLEDGTFVKAPMSVLTYGTMVFVRVMIVRDMSNRLAQAATIATRYSAVRKQSPINPDEPEPQILDHVTQQNKIFPQLAKSVIFKLAADLIIDIYNSVNSDLARGKHDRLPELHALSCALKAISSTDAVAGVEICRLSCGGHGYLECSGFPTLLGFVAAAYTYEGENTVLLLQTARYLMKAAKDPDLSPTVAFLKRYPDYKMKKRWDGSIGGMIEAFEAVAAAKIRIAAESVEQRILGHTANCAIVMAQLIIRGERQGIFPFFVQIRDENTHMPLRGVKVGDIGAKMGLKSTNNGFLGFTNHRIPRENTLMKNAQVLEDGTFVKAPMSVLTYGTMVFVRVMIVRDMSNRLAQAATIATRYSAVRKQSPINPDEPEPQILDHVTQQNKIFPQLAKSVIFKLAADLIIDIYNSVNSDLARGKHDRLPELHALSCALKAISSTDAVAGVEICRLSCGGHGYLECSGFPTLLGFVAAAYTYEGENTVLLLQTARYLMKAAKDPDLSPTVAFLKRYPDYKMKKRWDGSIGGMIEAFEAVAAAKIRIAAESVEQRIREGKKPGTAANLSSIELVAAADAHCRAFILRAGAESMEKVSKSVSPALAGVLKDLLELYAVDAAKKALGDLQRFTTISDGDVRQLQRRLEGVLARLRPNAVAIVDGFDFPDEVLKSALGAYDGNVYERIYEDAMKSPLNYEPVNASFHKYLKPFTKGNSKL
uniref:Acyl-coenzyme A oxidase n=2 Tax=Lutzomyia longipalpis TaxID=7200 RepID=A0A1B0CKT2_LUTLO